MPGFLRATLAVVGLGAAACGSEDASLDVGGELDLSCPGAIDFVPGIELRTSRTRSVVAISDAVPSPPDRGDNTWKIAVFDASGEPMIDASLAVRPWMPLHGHGTTPSVFEAVSPTAGEYEVDVFDLFMPGLWEFTVDIAAEDGEPDEAVFLFCVEG